MFAVLPFYAIFEGPETLLIIQTVVLALGAYPVFFLTKEVLGSERLGLYFSLFYLVYPQLFSVNVFDFHPDAFFVPLALAALYFFAKGKWKSYFTFMFLSFLTKESMAVMFVFFAIGELILLRGVTIESIRERRITSKKLAVVLFTMAVAVCYYLVAEQVIHMLNPSSVGFAEGSPWAILGVDPLNPSSLLHITSINLLGALSFDFETKLFFLLTVLAPLAFLPLFKLSKFLPVAAWLAVAFLSNYPPYYTLGWQYSAMIVPFAMTASIEGLHAFSSAFKLEKARTFRIMKKLFIVVILSALTFTFLMIPANGLSWISEHDQKLNDVLAWIERSPPGASILTQYDIFPHISNRMNSYVIPPLFSAFNKTYYFNYVESLFEMNIDYVILDFNSNPRTDALRITHLAALRSIEETGAYGLYASVDGILVYKHDYNGSLVEYEPFTMRSNYNTDIVYDTTLFSYTLPPGEYNATYVMKISPKITGNAFAIEVSQGGQILASSNVSGTEFENADEYESFSLTFKNPSSLQETEFSITNVSTATQVSISYMQIYAISFESNKGAPN
jgi:uncharacterized membrane protein